MPVVVPDDNQRTRRSDHLAVEFGDKLSCGKMAQMMLMLLARKRLNRGINLQLQFADAFEIIWYCTANNYRHGSPSDPFADGRSIVGADLFYELIVRRIRATDPG